MVKKIERSVVFCLLSFFLICLLPLEKKAEEYKPCYKYDLAFKFNLWTVNSRLYYCKSRPLTFYYRHDFEAGVAERFKTFKGELLMKFGGGVLTLEGLGLNEIALEENVTRRTPNDPFYETLKIKDSTGKEWTAIDISPYALAFPEGVKGWFSRNNCKINGYDRSIHIDFKMNGDKTHVIFSEVSANPRTPPSPDTIVGELDYEAQDQDTPWVLNSDLNGDGSDEIIIILCYYRNQEIMVFSTTPEKFNGARSVEKLFNSMGDWPNENSEIFKAGKSTVIPFRSLESLKTEQQESKQ